MTDYISRADAIEAVCKAECGFDYNEEKDYCTCTPIELIKALPSADAVHGEWLPIKRGDKGYSAGDFKCSVCGKPNKCFCLTDFCPNCGAKMGGGNND